MEPGIAFISQGRLLHRPSNGDPREIESDFVQQVMERRARQQETEGWKNRSGVWGSMGMAPPEMIQWEQAVAAPQRIARFSSVARTEDAGKMIYTIAFDAMGGLFEYDSTKDEERRLMHKDGFHARDLSRLPGGGAVAMSVAHPDGSASVMVGENDGRFLRDMTQGDSIDEAPAWIEGDGKRLVYQSAGIGRNEAGFAVGISSYAVELLDIDGRDISTVLYDDEIDYLQPRMLADGTLYYIRRPYKPVERRRPGFAATAKDVVLFPFRLGRAVFDFLNFFSMMFSGRPLSTAGGAARPQDASESDQRYLMLWGQMIDTKLAMQKAEKNSAEGGLVPEDWELVRRDADGVEAVLARRVLAWDLHPDGDVVHTNGSAVFHLAGDGESRELCRERMIERVVFV